VHRNRTTALITEDGPDPVRVPVVAYLAVLPYHRTNLAYDYHADGCDQCAGDGPFPCPVGGALADLAWTALDNQRTTARQN
jgi:hypothetical protein